MEQDISKFEFSFDIKSASKSESGERLIRGVASVEELDRDDEIIAMSAFKDSVAQYMKNPIIRYKHREEIGTAIKAELKGKELLIDAVIGKDFEPADTVWKKIEQGILKTFSVGGRIKETETIFSKELDKEVERIIKMELYEVSVVDIPANKNAIFSAIAKSLDKSLSESDTKMYDLKNNKEKTMSEEKTKQEEKPVEPEAPAAPEQPAQPEPTPEAKETSAETKVEKMYTAKEVDDQIQKAVESQSVRKAALAGPDTTKMKATFKTVEPYTKDAYGDQVFYYDGIKGRTDMRKEHAISFKEAYMNMAKATLSTHGGAGTATVGALIPLYVDPEVVDQTRREIPFIELVPRRATQGLTYDYNVITTTASGVSLNEDAAMNDVTDTLNRVSVVIRYIYSVGRVSGPAMAGARGYIDLLNFEVQQRTIALKRWEDQLAIQDETAPSFSGIQDAISTNTTALGGPTTIAAMRTEITQCLDTGAVRGNMIILTTNTLADSLRGLLMDYQRYVNTTKLAWGIETMSFDGIPVIVDRYVPSGVIFFVDMSVVHMAVLQDMVYEELAKTNDSIKFSLKMYEALVVRAEMFCSELTGCT